MDDDLKAVSHSLAEDTKKPAYTPKVSKPNRKSPRLTLLITGVAVVVAAGCYAGWKYIVNKPKVAVVIAPIVVQDTTPKVITDTPNDPLSETYTSPALSVGFKYPRTWKVSEANGGIRITSPQFTFQTAQVGDTVGNFHIYIRQGSRKVDGTYIGRGIAVKPSEKLVYTQPAPGQRADTLLSSFGFDSSDIFSFFLIAGNFQLNKGDSLGPNYGKEPDSYIVAGGYGTLTAVDDLAMSSVNLTYYATTNAYKQAVNIIGTLKLQ
jgi:hypothetical protein